MKMQLKDLLQTKGISKLRLIVQTGFLLFMAYSVLLYVKFINAVQAGTADISMRPGAVEGFLPIAGLMSFYHWLLRGEFDPLHPAAIVIFMAILITALLFRKGFCSWLCPVGTLFEWSGKIGEKIIKRRFRLPKYLDYALMSLKYIVLAFFTYFAINMVDYSLQVNAASDISMYQYWFVEGPGTIFIIGLIVLTLASLFIRNFWCRYLCPYGALLGIVALLSPLAIKRNDTLCINCGKCTKTCPNNLKVAEKTRVNSPECISCMTCIKDCPVEGALQYKFAIIKKGIPLWAYPIALLAVFILITEIAKLTGHWQTVITVQQYVQILNQ